MSKSKHIIAAKPHKERKIHQKQVNRRFRQIEAKVAYQAKTQDPFGIKAKLNERLANIDYGRIYGDK